MHLGHNTVYPRRTAVGAASRGAHTVAQLARGLHCDQLVINITTRARHQQRGLVQWYSVPVCYTVWHQKPSSKLKLKFALHAIGMPCPVSVKGEKLGAPDCSLHVGKVGDKDGKERYEESANPPSFPSEQTTFDTRATSRLDSGWSWMIVVGAWLISFLLAGFTLSFTILYQELMKQFNGSAAETAWVLATYGSVRMFSSEYDESLPSQSTISSL